MESLKRNPAKREGSAIRRPLLWSASAHLLAVMAMLLPAGRPPSFPGLAAVDVSLVRPSDGAGRVSAAPAAASPGGDGVPSGVPDRAPTENPERSPPRETAAPTDPPPSLPEARRAPEATPGPPSTSGEGRSAPPTGPAGTGAWPLPGNGEGEGGPDFVRTATDVRAPGSGQGTESSGGRAALLRNRIQSSITYPDEAVRRGQQGEVLLRIRIGRGGVPREILVARSSGARLLDDAARRGVVRAAPLPSAPGWVEVPVRFRLR